MIAPGATIGVLGGGQLGRMLALAAAPLGYRVHVYAPEGSGPAADVCARWVRGAYGDDAALARFAAEVDVVTFEFENVDAGALHRLSGVPVFPPPGALDVAQDRLAEKRFAASLGVPTAPFRDVPDAVALDVALGEIGTPAILKTRRFGYDGKGQARIADVADAGAAWAAIGGAPAILEGHVSFDHEFSVLLARGQDGATQTWDVPLNTHRDGILARSVVPAPPPVQAQAQLARGHARRIADALGYVGVLACEFFACADGPVFNEMAPRVHNSGHWTIEGAATSQFENHVRAVCGLPLGATSLTAAQVEMENLLGRDVERWADILADAHAHLHLYGKAEPRAGRKMGHVTRIPA